MYSRNRLKKELKLYAGTDCAWLRGRTLTHCVEEAIRGGATMVQLREKRKTWEDAMAEARELRALTERYHVPFLVNDDINLALACGADGVHVGQDDMPCAEARRLLGPEKIVGVSVHSVEQALAAARDGADYLGVGAVFATSTKRDAGAMPRETLQQICAATPLPVVAIGGISEENISSLAGCGLAGAAVVSAIFAKDDTQAAARNLLEQMKGWFPMATVLSIAGSDSSGGAGIQADIKTITAHKMFAMTAVTALTAQNTMGVTAVQEASPEFLAQQLDCVFQDIYPDSIKIGMVSSEALIRVIADKLQEYKADNIVVDPVMIATSGSRLLDEGAMDALVSRLIPLAKVITPNMAEAACLSGLPVRCKEEMEAAAEQIAKGYEGSILVKGGHLEGCADDLLYCQGEKLWIAGPRVDNPNTHGTGCTLSSAIACALADGYTVEESVERAKAYLTGALRAGLNLGHGSGPLNHMYNM